MGRELFIVSRDRGDLYRYLSQTFAEADNVEVIWDRRAAERGGPAVDSAAEPRPVDRRTRRSVEADLKAVGYAYLALD